MDQYADSGAPINFAPYQQAIKSIESSGGNYGLVGPSTANGDRAYGAYQVMGNNVPDWTEKHYGTRLTPQQFLKNREAQDAVFNGEFGSYLQKHGNPQDAASMWFSGRPLAQARNSSDGFLTTQQYVNKFNKALGFAGDDSSSDDGDTTAALSPDKVLGKGSLQTIVEGEKPNKLYSIGGALAQAGAALAGISNPTQGYVLSGLAKQIKDNAESKYKVQVGADGTIYRTDPSTGEVQAAKGPGGASKNFHIVMGKDGNGNPVPIGKFDANSGEYSAYGGANAQAQQPQINSIDDLRAIDPHRADAAQAVAEGRVAFPTNSRLNPRQQQLRDDVIAAFPGVDANVFAARKKFQESKAESIPSSFGGLISRQSIAADQLDKTLDAYGKLGNTDSMLGANAAKLENYLSAGGTEQARLRDMLETASGNAASDINAIQNGGRGTGHERENIKNALNLPYASHVEQSGAVQAHIDALKAGLEAKFNQEKSQLGEDFAKNDPDYQRLTKMIDQLQTKADQLYKGDFSYAKGARAADKPATQGDKRPPLNSFF